MRYKLKHRVLSFILALITMLTTANLPSLSFTTYAADPPNTDYNTAFERGIAIKSNADEHDIIDFAGEGFKPLFAPEIQTIRVTLIKTGESDNSNRGYPTTGKKSTNDIPEIQKNPIHMVPWDYDTTWGDDEDKVRSVKNTDTARPVDGLTVFNSRREYLAENQHNIEKLILDCKTILSML